MNPYTKPYGSYKFVDPKDSTWDPLNMPRQETTESSRELLRLDEFLARR